MTTTTSDTLTTRVLQGFDDPTLGRDQWNALVRRGDTDVVFLTWEYQQAWWETLGEGELLLIVAERDAEPVAIAPFYVDDGIAYLIGGKWKSDYLDLIGTVSAAVIEAVVTTAFDTAPGLSGFELYFVPDTSRTANLLHSLAKPLGLVFFDEWSVEAPVIDLQRDQRAATELSTRHRILDYERRLARTGSLQVEHLHASDDVLPCLDELFALHVARWEETESPSEFGEERNRRYIERIAQGASRAGWLRFTRLSHDGRTVAMHLGSSYGGRYMYDIPTYHADFASSSPGHILLRHLILDAMREDATLFDLGIGEQPYKARYATSRSNRVRGYGLYREDRT